MESTQRAQTSSALKFGRHIVGMALFALLNPLIYYSDSPMSRWFGNWAFAIVFALVVFGPYALFFTERAKAVWPKSFFTLAWVLLALITMEPYISDFNKRQSGSSTSANQSLPTKQQDWERGQFTPPVSEIDAFLAAPPSLEEAKQWTQENTGSTANGPWLSHAPTGARFCRLHDRTIIVLFPPGLRPDAEKANVFCANMSVDSPDGLGFTYEEVMGNGADDDEWLKKDKPVTQANEQHPGLTPFAGKLDGE